MSDESDMDEQTETEMLALLSTLTDEHRRIDSEIDALTLNGSPDRLKIQRMKKIKLSIKDQIAYIQNQLTPDIIA